MNTDEHFEMAENARRESAELLLPTGKATYCGNCCEPIEGEEANFNYHTELCGSPIRIQKTYCVPCVPEVIQYRYKMRNVAEMTRELPGWEPYIRKSVYQKLHEQEFDKQGKVKHI